LLISGLVAVLGAVVVAVTVIHVSNSPNAKNQLGEPVFQAPRAKDLAPEVAKGGPLLLQDLLNRSRDLYLQHLDPDPAKGWVAIEAHSPGAPRRCVLRWLASPPPPHFEDPCDGRKWPADGSGLTRWPATLNGAGRVVIDLRTPLP
jgi:hypothetical protein